MKKTLLAVATLFAMLISLPVTSFSQISVVSTTGYAVNIDVRPVAVIPAANTCQWGYRYNIQLKYNISITGNHKPSSMYTLQGIIGCGPAASTFDLPNEGGSGTAKSADAWNSASDCKAVTVSSLGCSQLKIIIEGPGISSRTIPMAASSPALPVQLVSFNANLKSDKVKLSWATATELNNDYFSIERSVNGIDWLELQKVKGAGNSNNLLSYEAYDEAPLAGISYYRLKQTDIDGQYSYSGVQVVTFTPGDKGISLYPVPNTGNTVNISGISDYRDREIALLNASGTVLFAAALNNSSIDLPALKPGLYILQLKNKRSGETQSLRYVKI